MIIGDEKEQQYYQIIKDSKIENFLTDYTDKEIVEFFKLSEFCVLDNYGKRLNIATFDELESFIKNIKDCRSTVRDKNNIRKKYSEKLEEFRKRRTLMPNEQLGEDFNQIVNIANSYYEEINDILTSIMFKTHADIIKKYIKQPDNDISNNIVFGLYIAVLKSFIEHKNIEIEDFNSVDYIVYLAFLKEFNNFYGENIDILEKYSKYFGLRKAEEDSIITLLNNTANGFKSNY